MSSLCQSLRAPSLIASSAALEAGEEEPGKLLKRRQLEAVEEGEDTFCEAGAEQGGGEAEVAAEQEQEEEQEENAAMEGIEEEEEEGEEEEERRWKVQVS